METFVKEKPFVDEPFYDAKRKESLNKLILNAIDSPLINIIEGLNNLPYCFTLQSCYGHFVHRGQSDTKNIESLIITDETATIEYRIAYVALCIQNNEHGGTLHRDLKEVSSIDKDFIQFGCAEWFWKRQVNSYILQVEPKLSKTKDKVYVTVQEALYIEKIREIFFSKLEELIQMRI